MLSAIMLLGINATQCFAEDPVYGKNGVSYVLLSSDFSHPGVYRYNNLDGSVRNSYAAKSTDVKVPLFLINTIQGKVSGLAANQENNVFLLSAIEGDGFYEAEPGWLPTGIKFEDDSNIYVSAALPSEGGATDYIRSGCPHGPYGSAFPANDSSLYVFWYKNVTLNGNTYKYVCRFNGPVGVKFLNGSSGLRGTPIWDGTYTTGGISTGAAIKHPTDPRKIILPSQFGALSYYLYGTKNEPAIQGLPMDGTNGRDKYIFTDANGAGYFTGDSRHAKATMFGCIVKRFYEKRENALNLYSGNDTTSSSGVPTNQSMRQTQANVLKTVDVKIKEAYGKLCGDNCIDGGEILGKPVESILSSVTVVTSTTGNRYGFNPLGTFRSADAMDQTSASLRVVKTNGTTKTIDLSTDKEGSTFSSNITNKAYLDSKGVTPAEMRTIGISSKFGSDLDYIYGSDADYFVVQDSWWGKGGIAYEYFRGNDENPGKIVKIDYMNNDGQTESQELGDLSGKVDAIAIDGEGYLYALKTEESPSDKSMEGIDAYAAPTTKTVTVGSDELEITYSGWKRDVTSVVGGETQNDGVIDVPDGEQKEKDYKIATIKQKVYKSVKRYPQATDSIGSEEDRGSMFAGYDTWTNNLAITSTGGYTWSFPIWRQEEGTRTSEMPAELAVVNVAETPVPIDAPKIRYITVTKAFDGNDDQMDYSVDQIIAEENSLEFKVEGYKPVINGKQRDLKPIGDIDATGFKDVKLNSIPNEKGEYAHDEDGDGKASGFPSHMFEAVGYDTKVTWKIAQVEDKVAVKLENAELISEIESIEGTGDYKSLLYKFKQPGRYIIQADVTFNIFNNLGQPGIRPYQLTAATEQFTTEPKLIQVYANALQLNKTDSYITDIKITPNNKKYEITGSKSSDSDYDTVEGVPANDTKEGKFGSLTISFKAQFFREVESNTANDLQTYDGIGVWDYNYYKKLYKEAKAKMPGIIEPIFKEVPPRAYNYSGDGDPATAYNPNIYNPGKVKGATIGDYKAGTKVNGSINTDDNIDKQFIQWALYLRPVTPQGDIQNPENTIFDRGDLIVSGTCAKASFTPIGDEADRKYNVSFTVDDIDSKIDIPRDPRDYTLDLEIVYPRVTWLNNDLGANLGDNHNYFSSVVPYTETSGASPIHVLSRLSISSTDNKINQSYKCEDTSIKIYEDDEPPYFTICARDKEKPTFADVSENLPYYETTGDPTIPGEFKYGISDNNPFLSAIEYASLYNENAKRITEDDAKLATDLAVQALRENKFDSTEANKKYELRTDTTKSVTISQTSNAVSFYSDDSWRITASYTLKTEKLSSSIFEPKGTLGAAPAAMIGKDYRLQMENWVGTLKYAIVGKFYDGLGKDSGYNVHYLYDDPVVYSSELADFPKVLTDEQKADAITSTTKEYLKRIDNDPASIEVELVSPNDNRRIVFQLAEGINDKVSCAKTVEDLAPSNLIVTTYKLNETDPMSTVNAIVPGTTNYYDKTTNAEPPAGCVASATVSDYLASTIPSFKRAGRLLVNVNIFDNCGFLDLNDAWIKVENGSSILLDKPIRKDASHELNGNMKESFKNKPRGIFAVDLPMQVEATQPQIRVTVFAKDLQGNERALIIPVNIVESSFETRVLETKEERKN